MTAWTDLSLTFPFDHFFFGFFPPDADDKKEKKGKDQTNTDIERIVIDSREPIRYTKSYKSDNIAVLVK